MFCFYQMKNLNPKGKKTGDCVIRAISLIANVPYEKVRDDLYALSVKSGYMMNDKRNNEKLLEQYGFVKHPQPRKYDGTKYEVGEIIRITEEPCIITCANHMTACKDSTIYDLWDCRHKCIGNYFTRKR